MDVGPEFAQNIQLLFHIYYIGWSFVYVHFKHAGDKFFKLIDEYINHAGGKRSGVRVALSIFGTKG